MNARSVNFREQYETRLITWAFAQTKLQPDKSPAGKRIERIVILRERIISQADFWPNWINIFHYTTRESVIRKELLFQEGEPYSEGRAQESERNLRQMFVLASAKVIACKGSRSDRVVMLVVTKDLWSIRLGLTYQQPALTQLGALIFRPTESNFLGLRKELSLTIGITQLELDTFKLRDMAVVGASYRDYRLFGSRLDLLIMGELFLDGDVPCGGAVAGTTGNRAWCPSTAPGSVNGGFAMVRLKRPLYSLSTKWGFSLETWLDFRQRRSYALNTSTPPPGQNSGLSLATVTLSSTGDQTAYVPLVYQSDQWFGSLSITRSYGRKLKHDLRFGLLSYYQTFQPPTGFPFTMEVRDLFKRSALPRAETALAFFGAYDIRPTRFVKLTNINSFGLTEDFALGPSLSVELRPAQNLIVPDAHFFTFLGSASYRFYRRDNLFTADLSFAARYQLGDGPEVGWVNQVLWAAVRNVFPRLWIGRFCALAEFSLRDRDLYRNYVQLTSNIVRGVGQTALLGRNSFRVSLEYRTRPINLRSLHLGGVLFYDGGAVWGRHGPDLPEVQFHYQQSMGFGVRFLFPQFDKEPLRLDFAIPLKRMTSKDLSQWPNWFFFSFSQAF